jgi:hypothetical protein
MLKEKISAWQAEIYSSVRANELGKRRADIPAAASHIREPPMVVKMAFRDGGGSCDVPNG